LHSSLSAASWRGSVLLAAALFLAACGGVQVRPMPGLPEPLLRPMPARVGLVLDADLRNYLHEEKRGNSGWQVQLGPGHEELFRSVMKASFGDVAEFQSAEAARAATGLQTIFRPYIEQFSFATAQETGGQYWAVTLRYRIGISAPGGESIDTLTLTGYGSARGGRAANALTRATRAAMRDAAAKFLVQMPRQPLAQKLRAGEVLTTEDAAEALVDVIETVPIEVETAAP
jgi:hypothetical protein